jgi:hypothetical protein
VSSEGSASDDGAERKRRRRAEKLLGGLLPDTSTDESDEGWSEKEGDTRDDEMRRDVPPHHGQ